MDWGESPGLSSLYALVHTEGERESARERESIVQISVTEPAVQSTKHSKFHILYKRSDTPLKNLLQQKFLWHSFPIFVA